MASTGTVVRFDRRRGYGFVQPDDGGEDVFVHQNNINMEGFRFLQVAERVTYELEVGEKGMKAVSVALLEPRAVRPGGGRDDEFGGEGGNYDDRDDRDAGAYQERAPREHDSRPPRDAQRDAAPAAAIITGAHLARFDQGDGDRLHALFADLQVVAHLFTNLKKAEAFHVDVVLVDEDVFAAVIRLDEAIAAAAIETDNGTGGRHWETSLICSWLVG